MIHGNSMMSMLKVAAYTSTTNKKRHPVFGVPCYCSGKLFPSSAYAHRDWRPGLALLKSPDLPPSLLKPLLSSLDIRLSAYGFRPGLVPKELLGKAPCPYRLPAVAPCQRLPEDGADALPLPERRKGRAGSSPGITCWGIDWPM